MSSNRRNASRHCFPRLHPVIAAQYVVASGAGGIGASVPGSRATFDCFRNRSKRCNPSLHLGIQKKKNTSGGYRGEGMTTTMTTTTTHGDACQCHLPSSQCVPSGMELRSPQGERLSMAKLLVVSTRRLLDDHARPGAEEEARQTELSPLRSAGKQSNQNDTMYA